MGIEITEQKKGTGVWGQQAEKLGSVKNGLWKISESTMQLDEPEAYLHSALYESFM